VTLPKKKGALAGIVNMPVCLRMTPSWLCFRVREDFSLFLRNTARPFPFMMEKAAWIFSSLLTKIRQKRYTWKLV